MKLLPIKEGLRFSVIVVSWNAIDHLARCVSKLFQDTQDFELIVVDNGSTDGSASFIRDLMDRHENVKAIFNTDNKNFGPGNNQGLEMAEGETIICLNSDTLVTKEWANRLEACLKHAPNIAIVGPVCNNSAGRQMVGDIVKQNSTGKPLDLDSASILYGNNNNRYSEAGTLYGWCMVFNREYLETQDYLFDDRFTNAYEDNDVCIRAQRAGWKMFIDFGTFIWHEGQASFRKRSDFYKHYIENGKINQELFQNKYRTDKKQKLIAVYRIANCEKYIAESMIQTSRFADEIICLFARSQDRTKDIALQFEKVTAWEEWTAAEHPFDEQAERDWLLQKAIERGADWIISIDGDEVYEDKFIDMVPRLMTNPNPHIVGYWCNWRTIWDHDEEGNELFRADSTFGKFQNYRFFKVLPGMRILPNDNIYNHHCGSAPQIPAESLQWLNVRVKHLGYDTEEQRKWKHAFYKKADPRPVLKDVGTSDYHHLIENNVALKPYRAQNRVSVMVVCRNEANLIHSMLSNVECVADEFVIVDTGSTDNTIAEVERFSRNTIKEVRIFEKKFTTDEDGYFLNYSEAKNYAKSLCRYEWILNMDCDECFQNQEVANIFAFIDEPVDAYLFSVINYLEPPMPNPQDSVYSISETIRLYRNIDEIFYTGLVHESLEDSITARVRARKGKLLNAPIMIHHRGFLKPKEHIRKKVDRYHRINKRQLEISGGKDPRPLFNMALHYMSEGERQTALACFNECMRLSPHFWRAKQNIAFMHLQEAKTYMAQAFAEMPTVYQGNTNKSREILDVLNKFSFETYKVC